MDKKRTVKLCYVQRFNFEIPHGIAVLRPLLQKSGFIVKEYTFYKHFNSFSRWVLSTNRHGKSFLNNMDYRYVHSHKHSYPFIKSLDRIIDSMSISNSDIIGISVVSAYQFVSCLALAKRIKERYDVPVIFGGSYVKLFHELIDLKKYRFIDYLICSDGETALPELLKFISGKKKDITSVPALKYVSGKEVISRKDASIDINDIPYPIYSDHLKTMLKQKGKHSLFWLPYEITKGCPHRCTYCSYYQLNSLSQKRISKVISELKLIKKETGHHLFRFTDSNITANKEYLKRLCREIIDSNLNIKWKVYATPSLDLALLKLMKKAGCVWLYYGIETGSQNVNRIMRKSVPISLAEKCIRETWRAGIKTFIFLMIGFPHEKSDDVNQTYLFLKRNKKYISVAEVNGFQLIYGSYIFNNPEEFKIRILGPISKVNQEVFKFDEIGGLSWEKKVKHVQSDFVTLKKKINRLKINFVHTPRIS